GPAAPRAKSGGCRTYGSCRYSCSWPSTPFWSMPSPSLMVPDADRLDDALGLRAREIDRQQAIPQVRSQDFNAVSQHKGPLELTRRDAAVKILPGLVVLL